MTTEKRTLLALALVAVVIMLFQVIYPTKPVAIAPDSTASHMPAPAAAPGAPAAAPAAPANAAPNVAPTATAGAAGAGAVAAAASVRAETTEVRTTHARYVFTNIGATPTTVTMLDYKSTQIGRRDQPVELGRPGEPVLRYLVVSPHDTLDLSRTPFTASRSTGPDGSQQLAYIADIRGNHVALTYTIDSTGYLAKVHGTVTGPAVVPEKTYLLADLPSSFQSAEADTLDDQRHFAFAVKPLRDDPKGFTFAKLDTAEQIVHGPVSWAAGRDKYFVVGLLSLSAAPFSEVHLIGAPKAPGSKNATVGYARVLIPVQNGALTFDLYAGPQEWRRLHALGREFEDVNPYGGFIHSIMQPFATLIVRVILWMRQKLQLNYGWVIIIFGLGIRILLWPLNSRAMRTSLKMQVLQPELQAVQERYKQDPQRLQTEMMKVYKEHGLSPLSPVAGCLPMLIPMPILLCLLFVLQNTIEFRGVPFLWLADISLKDPYYILPLLMGASSYLVSWIGMRNSPPNPQAKMMSYMFPVMMTMFLANVAAGLNLYYAVQNLATLPQQWLLSIERAKARAGSPDAKERGR